MKKRSTLIIVGLAIAAVAFVLGPIIWPPSPDVQPTRGEFPFFVILAAIDSISFAIGVLLLFGTWRVFRTSLALSRREAFATYLSVTWLIISWWPHVNFHSANGMNALGILYIDYGFHVTLTIAGLIVVRSLIKLIRAETRAR